IMKFTLGATTPWGSVAKGIPPAPSLSQRKWWPGTGRTVWILKKAPSPTSVLSSSSTVTKLIVRFLRFLFLPQGTTAAPVGDCVRPKCALPASRCLLGHFHRIAERPFSVMRDGHRAWAAPAALTQKRHFPAQHCFESGQHEATPDSRHHHRASQEVLAEDPAWLNKSGLKLSGRVLHGQPQAAQPLLWGEREQQYLEAKPCSPPSAVQLVG
ncbi:hypothetical protein E2320_013235, partial [Naja naja]